jgi:molybdopterin molybdotransferase
MKTGLLDLDDALRQLLDQAAPVGDSETESEAETVSTLDACGRVLALDQVSALDVPPMDNSQMDGYALRIADLAAAARPTPAGPALRVSQRIAAGHVGRPLEPGTAARIFTGATIPDGADAVVMQEQVSVDGDHVVLRETPAAGDWIRRTGEDIRAGSVILAAGSVLTPQAMGLAASVGLASLPVRRRVRVACFFTGDELVMPGEPLAPGAIYNSNRFLLTGLLRTFGCDVVDLGIVPDALDATRAALREAAAGCDLIVTSGGVSVGEEDHVKPAVQAEGELQLWQIAMKPGKPLAYGRIRRGLNFGERDDAVGPTRAADPTPVAGGVSNDHDADFAHFIGLPGNPVSSFVTFLILVRPFVQRLQGRSPEWKNGQDGRDAHSGHALPMRADFDWPSPDRRREFLRVQRNADGGLDLFPNQGSAVLTSTVWADGLVDNPPSHPIVRGDTVRFLPFAELMR